VVVYTGFGYSGRDLLFVRSSDAMIIGPGRIGTLNEFSVAFEDRRPLGILEGSWKTDELLRQVIEEAHRPNPHVIFDADPKAMVERLVEMVMKEREETMLIYNTHEIGMPGKGSEVIL